MLGPLTRAVHIVGGPLGLGGARRGVGMGPSAIRIVGLGEPLAAMGLSVVGNGDLAAPIRETRIARDPAKRCVREISRVCQRLHQQVLRASAEDALPVTLDGNDSLAAGTVGASADSAARRGRPIGLIWIDAHGDMNTPQTTESGNVHGMPLAALLGHEPADLANITAVLGTELVSSVLGEGIVKPRAPCCVLSARC